MLNSKHFIGIHGYMLVYSVGSQQSFDMMQVIYDKILNNLVRGQPDWSFRPTDKNRVRTLCLL